MTEQPETSRLTTLHSVNPRTKAKQPVSADDSTSAARAVEYTVTRGGIEAQPQIGVNRRAVLAFDLAGEAYWSQARGRGAKPFPPGALGEHLVVKDLTADLCLGDELEIGTARFRVTAPLTWGELGERMGRRLDLPRLPKTAHFRESQCPAVWLQVTQEGVLKVTDPVSIVPAADRSVPVTEALRKWGWDPALRAHLEELGKVAARDGSDALVTAHELGKWHNGQAPAVAHALLATQRRGIATAVKGTLAQRTA